MPSRPLRNRYARRVRNSERQARMAVRCFAADLTALQTAQLSSLSRNTVSRMAIAPVSSYFFEARATLLANVHTAHHS